MKSRLCIKTVASLSHIHSNVHPHIPLIQLLLANLDTEKYSTQEYQSVCPFVGIGPPRQRVCVSPLGPIGGGASVACGWGGEGPNSDKEQKACMALCIVYTLCTEPYYANLKLFLWPLSTSLHFHCMVPRNCICFMSSVVIPGKLRLLFIIYVLYMYNV